MVDEDRVARGGGEECAYVTSFIDWNLFAQQILDYCFLTKLTCNIYW